MKPDENGIYRWRHSVNLYRNPGILWLLCKVFSWIFVGVIVFEMCLDGFEFGLSFVKWHLVAYAGMIAIVTASYYVYALIQGGRYTWDFEMDEKGVNAVQAPNEAKRNKALGLVVAAMGVATGNATQMGVGATVASRDGMYSRFESVGTIKADRRHNTIHIRNGLFHNQIFAGDGDFDFVLEYIVARCPKAKIKR